MQSGTKLFFRKEKVNGHRKGSVGQSYVILSPTFLRTPPRIHAVDTRPSARFEADMPYIKLLGSMCTCIHWATCSHLHEWSSVQV